MVTKQEVIELGITKIVSRYDYADWLFRKKNVPIDFDVELEYFRILEFYGEEYIKKARNINTNNYLREKRIKKKIQNYVAFGSCVFATLTFTDEVLCSTDENTRRKYVSRFLKSISPHYIANIDYGSTTEREHYHAVIQIDRVDSKWKYGFAWYEKVHPTGNKKKLAEYISKLTKHSVKACLKKTTFIFSKDIENIDWENL